MTSAFIFGPYFKLFGLLDPPWIGGTMLLSLVLSVLHSVFIVVRHVHFIDVFAHSMARIVVGTAHPGVSSH